MSCLVPPACVFCHHYHLERNEHTDELPSCNAFSAIPDEIFMGLVDHTEAFPGDNGVRFGLRKAEREAFLDLNAVRQELGLLVYREPKRNTCRPVGGDNRETSERTEEDMGMTRRTFI